MFWTEQKRYFGSPKIPAPAVIQPSPRETDPAVQNAIAEATRSRKAAKGYRSTILASKMMSDQPQGSQLLTTLGS